MIPCGRLAVWKRARAATLDVYRATRDFPREETFGLTVQVRRAAVSVGANIVEGTKRRSTRDFAHFLNIAEGSAAEAAYLLGLCADLAYGSRPELQRLAVEYSQIERMICALRKRVLHAGPTPA